MAKIPSKPYSNTTVAGIGKHATPSSLANDSRAVFGTDKQASVTGTGSWFVYNPSGVKRLA